MFEEIKALKELLDMGAITQEDFDEKKAELLNQPIKAQQLTSPPPQPHHSQVGASSQASYGKSKIAAGLLAIFVGTLGIHKFYLGYTTQGIVMLLVSLFGSILLGFGAVVMGVIALIEGVIYLTKADEDFNTIYVQGCKGWF